MSTDQTDIDFENENLGGGKSRSTKASVWDYFERFTGDDGSRKQRCIKCEKVYSCGPKSGTSTLRRHLRKCFPQPLTQISPSEVNPSTNTARSSDELADEASAAKKLKMDNLQNKSDRELVEFIWMNKRNIGLLEEKMPDKAVTLKEALKCHEAEIYRRARLLHPKNSPGPDTSIVAVKIEEDDGQYEKLVQNMVKDVGAVEGATIETCADENQETGQQFDDGNLVSNVTVGNQSVTETEAIDRNITEEERAGSLQIVAQSGNQNEASLQQTPISVPPQDIYSELKKVSSMLSLLTSPTIYYTPQGNPLDEEAENAKESLIQLLQKDFETIVDSPDTQKVKSCIQILTKNLDKLPRFQGRVIQTLNSEFESTCQNWRTWSKKIDMNSELEVKQGYNLEALQKWQWKDMDLEPKIAKVDADISRLKAELLAKELTREKLVKQKLDLFEQSKISIDEAKKVLEEMVATKLQSDTALYNMKDLSTRWEIFREDFQR